MLYLLGQAEFLRGDCRASVRYFAEVKQFEIPRTVEDAMRPYLAECAERLLEAPEPAEAPPEEQPSTDDAIEPVLEPTPPPDDGEGDRPAAPRRWYQDPLGDVLVATGVLGAAAGASLLGVALSRRTGAASYGELEGDASSIRAFRIAGGATLGVGAALMIGGWIRWGVVARRTRPSSARVGVTIDGTTAGVSVHGRF